MKKYNLILTGLSLMCLEIMQAGPVEDLTKSKEEILKGKQKLIDTIEQLKKAYNDQKTSMLDKLATASQNIASQKSTIDKAYDISKEVRVAVIAASANPLFQPITIPVLALLGDAPEIIGSLKDTVNSIQSTVNTLDSSVRSKIEYLNPATDPKGIFKQGQVAIQKFGEVEKKMDQIIKGLKEAFAAAFEEE